MEGGECRVGSGGEWGVESGEWRVGSEECLHNAPYTHTRVPSTAQRLTSGSDLAVGQSQIMQSVSEGLQSRAQ